MQNSETSFFYDFRYSGTYKDDGRKFFLPLYATVKKDFKTYSPERQKEMLVHRLNTVDAKPGKLNRPITVTIRSLDRDGSKGGKPQTLDEFEVAID